MRPEFTECLAQPSCPHCSKCAISMATPARPDNATQILVARCRVDAGLGELDVPDAAVPGPSSG
jgi:hypothetical protein